MWYPSHGSDRKRLQRVCVWLSHFDFYTQIGCWWTASLQINGFFRSYRYFPFTRKDGIRTCQIFQVSVLYQPKSTRYLFFIELHVLLNSLRQPGKAAEPIFVGWCNILEHFETLADSTFCLFWQSMLKKRQKRLSSISRRRIVFIRWESQRQMYWVVNR